MVGCGIALLLLRCASRPDTAVRPTHAIEACGERFDAGTRVVGWREPDGYDAHRRGKWFAPAEEPDGRLRYTPLRSNSATNLGELRHVVHQLVIHFDVCGTSRQCFKVLHDVRDLSVHFLLDVDGTIYQTLDLREKAHHAGVANDGSIGVEIAHPGAWAQPLNADMRRWYVRDDAGWRMRVPPGIEAHVLTEGFVARPDRPELVTGEVHGRTYHQFDFTAQQYEALVRLCAALSAVFPRLRLEVPRDASGEILQRALSSDELQAFDGLVGHFHVTSAKIDPGPALQWERLLTEARALRSPP
jgi:N-acetylmuramoyl-L-alanine amidase